MRQYIVEGLLSDPENVVVDVDLLTPDDAGATHFRPVEPERYEHLCIAPDDSKIIGDLVSDLAPHAIINLTAAPVLGDTSDPTQDASSKILASANLPSACTGGQGNSDGNPQRPQPRFIQVASTESLMPMSSEPFEQIRVVDGETTRAHHDDANAGARLIEHGRTGDDISTINVTVSNTFGPYQSAECFVPRTIETLLRQQTLPVQCDTRNWVFVEDAADAVIFLSQHGTKGGCYAVDSTGGRYSDLGLAELICDQLDQIIPCANESYRDYLKASPAVANRYQQDTAGVQRLHEGLGWKPLNDFHCALAATVRWYVDQPSWWGQSPFIAGAALNQAVGGSSR